MYDLQETHCGTGLILTAGSNYHGISYAAAHVARASIDLAHLVSNLTRTICYSTGVKQ